MNWSLARNLVKDFVREPCMLIAFPILIGHEVIARVWTVAAEALVGPHEGPFF